MRADALPRAVLEQLRELDCVLPGQIVCCALSGGADSVCLLRCLLELRQRLGITVTAVAQRATGMRSFAGGSVRRWACV